MKRQKLILGNWKMNKTGEEARIYMKEFLVGLHSLSFHDHHMIGIAPTYTSLAACHSCMMESSCKHLYLGAQNVHFEEQGAFTGEIAFRFLQEFQVNFVLIGHSERRHLFHEDNTMIAKKMQAVASHGGIPVLCIGETLEERENGLTQAVLAKQIEMGCSLLHQNSALVLAYEPVWAIGTGKVASYDEVDRIHTFCREVCERIFSTEKASKTPILYGGSVNQNNAQGFAHLQHVDGLLIGGASLEASTMLQIIKDFLML